MSHYLQRLASNAAGRSGNIRPQAIAAPWEPSRRVETDSPWIEESATVFARPHAQPVAAEPERSHVPADSAPARLRPAKAGESVSVSETEDAPASGVQYPVGTVGEMGVLIPDTENAKGTTALKSKQFEEVREPTALPRNESERDFRTEEPKALLPVQPQPLNATGFSRFRKKPTAMASAKTPVHETDEVQIHIGRIEVTAALPAPAAATKTRPSGPSLSEYLRRRDGRSL